MITAEDFRASAAELDSLANAAGGYIELELNGTSESVMPHLLVMLKDPVTCKTSVEVIALAVPFNTHTEKHAALYSQGLRLYREQKCPIALTLISEAWISTQAPDQPRQYLLPEDDPERLEAVIYHTVAMDQQSRHGFRVCRRDARKRLFAASGDWYISPDNCAHSPLLRSFFLGFFAKAILRQATAGAAR